MKRRIIASIMACCLAFTTLLTGCSGGDAKQKEERQHKTAKYESYIENNPISLEEKLMSAEYSMNNTKTTIEIGQDKSQNNIMRVNVSDFGEVALYTINKDSYLYINTENSEGDVGNWYHTVLTEQDETSDLTSSFSEMVSIEDIFDNIKSCKYNKTMTQDDVEYDVLKAIAEVTPNPTEAPETPSEEEGNGVDVDIVGEENHENEQAIYLYINTETEKLEKIQTSEDGYSIVIRFSDLESLVLPSNITITESSEEDFMMSFLDGFLGILSNAITPTQEIPSEDVALNDIPSDQAQVVKPEE